MVMSSSINFSIFYIFYMRNTILYVIVGEAGSVL